jgi:hypothetical protein
VVWGMGKEIRREVPNNFCQIFLVEDKIKSKIPKKKKKNSGKILSRGLKPVKNTTLKLWTIFFPKVNFPGHSFFPPRYKSSV